MQNDTKKASQSAPKKVFRLTMQPLLVAGAVAFTSGCATVPEEQMSTKDLITPRIAGTVLPEGSIRYDTDSEQIAMLWASAEQARLEENNDLALTRLFEALEYAPQNSLLWSRAAEIQLNSEQASLAENFAIKSNTFAGDNVSLLRRNWLIIEHARSLRGDLLGVRSAHKKVQEYQYK